MKFIVSSSALLKQLQQISGVINANTVLPILEDFLFEVEKNKLTVVATDLETVMKVHLEVEAKDSGQGVYPRQDPDRLPEEYPRSATDLQYRQTFCGRADQRQWKYKVMGENPDNFPKEPASG